MRRSLVGVGLFLFTAAACGRDIAPATERVASTRQPLIAAAEEIQGQDLKAKEIVLTFDDGPGPLNVTGELADWLSKRPKPIVATFFVNGACIKATTLPNDSCQAPVPDAEASLAKIRASGHWVANHSTTHRAMSTIGNDVAKDLEETDTLIAKYTLHNRMFFRAPYGDWNQGAFDAVKNTPMNKYAGPVYWTAGGGPTNNDRAADHECWNQNFTTKKCGDLYIKEIKAIGNGIVLFHDPYGNTANHAENTGTGNTVDMVKYIVPKLEADGFTFKTLADVPALAKVLAKCDASCGSECKGPAATDCLTCPDGKAATDGKCAGGTSSSGDGGTSGEPSSSSSSSGTGSSSSGSNTSSGNDGLKPGSEAPPPAEEGCNASGSDTTSGGLTAAVLGLALALSLRSRRRSV